MTNSTNETHRAPDFWAWVLLLVLSLIWGSSYFLIKKSLLAFTPIQVSLLRVSITSIAFLPFFIARFKQIDWSKWKYFAVVGLVGSGIPSFLFALAQTKISSSIAGILSSLMPLFTLVLGIIFYQSPYNKLKIVGVVIGLLGAVSLMLLGRQSGAVGSIFSCLLVVVATICYAISSNTTKVGLQSVDALTISAAAFFIAGVPAVIGLSFSGVEKSFASENALYSFLALATLSIMSTVIASVYYFKLIQRTSPLFASTVSYLTPTIATFLGSISGETVTIYHFFGIFLISIGVYLTSK